MTEQQKEKINLCRSNSEKVRKLFYIEKHPEKTDEILNILYTEEEFKILMDIDYEEWLAGPFPILLDCVVKEGELEL